MPDDQSIIINNPDVIPAGDDTGSDMPPSYLANHIDWANKAYSEMMEHAAAAKREGRLAVSCAIRLGRELCIIKMHCKHGQWERLFSSASRRIKDDEDSNVADVQHFNFSYDTARRYMSAWKKIDAELDTEDQCKLAMAIQETPDSKPLPPSLLGKAGQAETLTQMYLDLGIISKPPAPAKAQHETILTNRNTKGRPVAAPVPLPEAMQQAVGDLPTEEATSKGKRLMANRDAKHICDLLDNYFADHLPPYLSRDEKRLFAAALREAAQTIEESTCHA